MTENFLKVFKEFEKENVEYTLVGGYAVVLLGYTRFTEDIDILIADSEQNIEKLKKALNNIYDDESLQEITLNELTQYPVIRYFTPDGFNIDIIISLGTAFNYNNIESELIDQNGQIIKIATAEALYTMKKDTLRPSDQMDVLYLKEIISKKRKSQS